jgi:N-acetylneuraminate synthase
MSNPLFDRLFVCDIANNHQGSVDHARKIIDGMANVARENDVRIGFKFQFRELDSFIHPQFKDNKDVKHIDRFLSTRMSTEEFGSLVEYASSEGLTTIATPFDEASVQQCLDCNIDIIKIASCSALDWPLLEAVASAGKPVIISSGGLDFSEIDKIVSFLQHKNVDFALMHCVSVYPTPNTLVHMDTVSRFQNRYPGVAVGYSGHESPENTEVAVVAIAKGAKLIERHVGVETDDIKLNAYSMTPKQTDTWVKAALRAWEISGNAQKNISDEEKASLVTLMRGTYAAKPIAKGQEVTAEDVYFAMPLQEGQLSSGSFGSYRSVYTATQDYAPDEPIFFFFSPDPILIVRNAIHKAKGMLNEANVCISNDCSLELSHHYGLDRFEEIGATIINSINREYCKKFIIVFPGQRHPSHKHEKKEETFEMLWGDLEVQLDDEIMQLKPGDSVLVKRNTWHRFSTVGGAIFEEISTTHYRDDSHYKDETISAMDPMERKTLIDPWNG